MNHLNKAIHFNEEKLKKLIILIKQNLDNDIICGLRNLTLILSAWKHLQHNLSHWINNSHCKCVWEIEIVNRIKENYFTLLIQLTYLVINQMVNGNTPKNWLELYHRLFRDVINMFIFVWQISCLSRFMIGQCGKDVQIFVEVHNSYSTS